MLGCFVTTVTDGIFVIKARFAVIVIIRTGVPFVTIRPFATIVTREPTGGLGTILTTVVAVAIDKIGFVGPFVTISALAPIVSSSTFPTTVFAVTIDKIVNRVQFITIDTIGSLNRSRHNRNPRRRGGGGGGGGGVSFTQYKYTRASRIVKQKTESFTMFLLFRLSGSGSALRPQPVQPARPR
jgi:hypothetical protein